jgi:hypothetical protein
MKTFLRAHLTVLSIHSIPFHPFFHLSVVRCCYRVISCSSVCASSSRTRPTSSTNTLPRRRVTCRHSVNCPPTRASTRRPWTWPWRAARAQRKTWASISRMYVTPHHVKHHATHHVMPCLYLLTVSLSLQGLLFFICSLFFLLPIGLVSFILILLLFRVLFFNRSKLSPLLKILLRVL